MTQFYTARNNARTTLASGYTAGAGSLVVTDGTVFGSTWPAKVTVITAASYGSTSEVLTVFSVTGRSGNTLTGVAAAEGTTDQDFAAGAIVEMRPTAAHFNDLANAVNTLETTTASLSSSVATNTSNIATNTSSIASLTTIVSAKADDASVVHLSGNEVIGGAKTFSSTITGSVTGNAGTVTTINGRVAAGSGINLTGSGTSGSPYTIAAINAGTVTSVTFTGDGTVLSSTPSSAVTSSGTVTASLAQAAAYTCLANGTGSTAAPTYVPYFGGSQTLTGAATLTKDSPSYTICDMTGGAYAVTLPSSAASPGKEFVFERRGSSNTLTLTAAGSDVITTDIGTASTLGMAPSGTGRRYTVRLFTDGSGTWYSQWCPAGAAFPLTVPYGGTGTQFFPAGSVVVGNGGSPLNSSGTGTSTQLLQSNGSSAPSWTSNPTITHVIGGGTAPTVAATGTGAGTSPTLSIVAGGHDLGGQISILTGTSPGTSTTVATVSFGAGAYPSAPAAVILTPANAAAAALTGGAAVYVSSTTTGGFVLSVGSTGLTASTQYLWNFAVIG